MRFQKLLLLLSLCIASSVALAQQTYYGNVGEYVSLPEPTPPSSAYTVMQMTYSTQSEHLYVASGTSRVKILSYFSGREVVKCEYRMVRQYTIGSSPIVYEDWQTGTQYYYISCLGSAPDPDPDPDPSGWENGQLYQDKTTEGHYMWFCVLTYTDGYKACVSPNDYTNESCVGSLIGGKVSIPEYAKGLEVVGVSNASFYKLTKITEIVIPKTVRWIGPYAVLSCTGIQKITSLAETPPTSNPSDGLIFDYDIFYNTTLFVPKGSKSKYSTAKGWEKFKTIKEIGEEENEVEPISIVLPNYTENIKVGQSITLVPTIAPINATTTLNWTSSDNSVATVSQSGVVKGIKVGESKITVTTSNNMSAYCYVKVTEDVIYVSSISLNSTSASLNIGDTKQLIATISPSNATDKSVSWSSSNTSVAQVSSSGGVTAKSAGSATITCKANDGSGKSAICSVTVKSSTIEPTDITLPSSRTVKVGETFIMTYTLTPSNATTTLTWTSDDTSIATVSSSGVVKGIKVGTTKIRVKTSNGKTDYCNVSVEWNNGNLNDGDTFTAYTAEGVEMTFKVISSKDRTCQVGIGEYQNTAINTNTTRKITIPEIVNGFRVIEIGQSSFYNCKQITSVSIPNTIVKLGDDAFQDCTSITSFSIPTSVKIIGDGVFWGCDAVKSITIPNSVTSLGWIAICFCDKLEEVIISASVENIGSEFCEFCPNIKTIRVDSDNKKYDSRNNCNAIIETSSNKLILGCQKTTIPNTVTSIGESAFEGCSQRFSLSIPNSVVSIGKRAFYANGLTSINLPSSIVEIGEYAFESSYNITELVLPKSLKRIEKGAFSWCDKLQSITIPSSIEFIGENAFYKFEEKNKLISVICYINEPFDIPESAFSCYEDGGIPADAILYVPYNTKDKYVSKTGWKNFNTILEMEKPDKEVSLSSSGYATFYSSNSSYTLPYGLFAQVVTGTSNSKLTFKTIADGSVSGVIPRGTAVMLVSDTHLAGTYTLKSSESTTTYTGTNLLHGSDKDTKTTGDGMHYKLSYGPSGTQWSDVFGWYWGAQNGAPFQIEGHKAWLVVPNTNSSRAAGFTIDGDATELEVIEQEVSTMDHYYDLQGRRVNHQPTRKGVYIKNGKKMIVK